MKVLRWLVSIIFLTEVAFATVVTTLQDEDDGGLDPGNGSGISLREAINHSPAATTITFDAALSGGIVVLLGSELVIEKDLAVDASGLAEKLTVDAGASEEQPFRVLTVSAEATVTISSVWITGGIGEDGADASSGNSGEAGAGGGGILNLGTLNLVGCRVFENQAGGGGSLSFDDFGSTGGKGGGGGGVSNHGHLALVGTSVVGNQAGKGGGSSFGEIGTAAGIGGDGGAIYSDGSLTVISSTVSQNRAGPGGGGPDFGSLAPGGAGGNGGGIYSLGALDVSGSEILGNVSGVGGTITFFGPGGSAGGIYCESTVDGGTVRISDSRVANNSTASGGAGGGFLTNGSCEIQNCEVTSNSTGRGFADSSAGFTTNGGRGGGISHESGELSLIGCEILLNRTGSGDFDNVGTNGGDGGGLYNQGAANVVRCTFDRNLTGISGGGNGGAARGGAGGGIFNAGVLSLNTSTVSVNETGRGAGGSQFDFVPGRGGSGGGIYNLGSVIVENVTIFSNVCGAGGAGDGISGGEGGSGGGLFAGGEVELNSVTVFGNESGLGGESSNGTTDGSGGGLIIGGTTELQNSIIAGNRVGASPDLDATGDGGAITVVGSNLIGILDGSSLVDGQDGVVGGNLAMPLDPLLGPPRFYGGATQSLRPLAGSAAIDAGGATVLSMDQRGAPRVSNGVIDLGAVEFQGAIGEAMLNFEGDDDGDGATNGLEIAIGSNPATSDAGHPGRLRIDFDEQGNTLLFFGYDQALESEISLRLTRSTDLSEFPNEVISNEAQPFEPPVQGEVEAVDLTGEFDRAFYRLEATLRLD